MSLLVEACLGEYHVSIDSMTPEVHDHLRGIAGARSRASQNVAALRNVLKQNDRKIKIVIKTIVMGYNAKEILPLVEWVEKSGFDEIKFPPLESSLEGVDNPQWCKYSPFWPK